MTALAYLHENGLDAEPLMGDQIAVWPEGSITPAMERWIIEHKSQLVAELRRDGTLRPWTVLCDGKPLATMLSPCTTVEEAQESAALRWPGKAITVQSWTNKGQSERNQP